MKQVTICGPRKFLSTMNEVKKTFERQFMIVNMPNFSFTKEEISKFTPDQFDKLHEQHYSKMLNSDFIYIVNEGGYIGDDTKREIEYALKNKKEIVYHEDPNALKLWQVSALIKHDQRYITEVVGIFTSEEKATKVYSREKHRESDKNKDVVQVSIIPVTANVDNWDEILGERPLTSLHSVTYVDKETATGNGKELFNKTTFCINTLGFSSIRNALTNYLLNTYDTFAEAKQAFEELKTDKESPEKFYQIFLFVLYGETGELVLLDSKKFRDLMSVPSKIYAAEDNEKP